MASALHDLPGGLSRRISFLGVPQSFPAHLLLWAFGADVPVLGTTSPLNSQDPLYPFIEVVTKCHFFLEALLHHPVCSLSEPLQSHLFLEFVATRDHRCFVPSATCSESRCLAHGRWPVNIC